MNKNSSVPGDEDILALKGDDLQFIPLSGGEPKKRATLPGVIKIIGFHRRDKDKLLILFKANSGISVGILSLKDGKVSSLPYAKEDESMLTHLIGWIRVYDNGNTTVEVKPDDVQQGKWTNVYIKRGNDSSQNISKCNGINCRQPSLSFDSNKVVYIKAQSQEPR